VNGVTVTPSRVTYTASGKGRNTGSKILQRYRLPSQKPSSGVRSLRLRGGCSKFYAFDGDYRQEVAEFCHCEHGTAKYEAERSSDVTQERQDRVRHPSIDVPVLHV